MRQSLAIAFACVLVGGCSLIYNPNDLANKVDAKIFQDAPIDVPPDVEIIMPADPSMLHLAEVWPTTIDEGRGDSGSRPALLVLRGSNFDGSDNLVVTLSPDDAGEAITFDTTVASDHNFIALAATAPVDSTCHEGTMHTYTVGVVEDNATMQQLPSALKLACHEELTQATLDTANLEPMYSQVKVAGNLTITGAPAAIIKSASNIEIDGTVTANANGQTAGPGGSTGGAIGVAGGGAGGGQGALLGGGGAGFATAGTAASGGGAGGAAIGEPSVTSYATNYASGGGGDGTLSSLGAAGGGGGGTIELTANGDITLTTVTAAGGGVNSGTGAGAGGLIVIRPLGGTTHGSVTLNVPGGTPGNAGSAGRTRVDGVTTSKIVAGYHGPGFGTVPLYSAGVQVPTIPTVATSFDLVSGIVINRMGFIANFEFTGGQDPGIGYGGANAMPSLTSGYNQVCVVVKNGSSAIDVAKDCIEMAFLP